MVRKARRTLRQAACPLLVVDACMFYGTGMTSKPVSIKRRKLSDEVQDQLLTIIHSGNLQPGDTLPSERELMANFQVGRPAIREAMQNLQRMGLVDIRHGERPKVAKPSINQMVGQMSETMRHVLSYSETSMEHLKEARLTFECEMARVAAAKATSADIDHLRHLISLEEGARQDSGRFMNLDGEFHKALAGISGNPIFSGLSRALFDWLAHFHIDLVRKEGVENLTIAEHSLIVDAVEAGDAVQAATAMANHLNRANKLYHQKHLGQV